MPLPALAIAAGISGITSLVGGLFGSSASKKAAQTQADAAAAAGQQVIDATNAANPQIRDAATRAGDMVRGTAGDAASAAWTTADVANLKLDPYAAAGGSVVNDLAVAARAQAPTMDDLMIDPGFAFRLKEGQKALERSAAARGGVLGGGALKAITRYAQDYSSNEFSAAFDRFRATQADRYARLSDVAKLGYSASGTQGNNLIEAQRYAGDITTDAARFAGAADVDAANAMAANTISAARARGEYLTQGANATAAGQVGSANAWGGALTGGVSNALMIRELLKNPAAKN